MKPVHPLFKGPCLVLSLALAGCVSDGGFSTTAGMRGGDGADPGRPAPTLTSVEPGTDAVATIALQGGGVLGATAGLLGEVGNAVGEGVSPGLGGVLDNTGQAVGALSAGVSGGLGRFGSIADPIGVTVGGVPPAVESLGEAVSSAGEAVRSIGSGPLGGLAPVTRTAGALVDRTGGLVTQTGGRLGAVVGNESVRQVTGGVSEVVTPLVGGLLTGTQNVGDTLGVGRPVNNLLTQVGGGVQSLGNSVSGDGRRPVVNEVGQVASSLGTTISALGGVVHAGGSQGAGPGSAGGVLGSLTGGLGGAAGGGFGGGGGGVGGGVAAGLTGTVGSLGAGLGGTVGGGLGGSGGAHSSPVGLLAPVGNLLGGLTGRR